MKPTFLYIKRHTITGKYYFGKTVKHPEKYKGSGVYWRRHIAKHGEEYVETVWFCLFYEFTDLQQFALSFSELNNIDTSDNWCNHIYETGLDGGSLPGKGNGVFGKPSHWRGKKQTAEHKQKVIDSRLRRFTEIGHGPKLSEEHKLKISNSLSKLFEDPSKNPMFGKFGKDNPNFGKKRSEEFKQAQSERMKGEKNGMFGKHLSDEAKKKKSEKMTGYQYEKVLCPHCERLVGINSKRWHFDNCKLKS